VVLAWPTGKVSPDLAAFVAAARTVAEGHRARVSVEPALSLTSNAAGA
jgi:hypothetical protein